MRKSWHTLNDPAAASSAVLACDTHPPAADEVNRRCSHNSVALMCPEVVHTRSGHGDQSSIGCGTTSLASPGRVPHAVPVEILNGRSGAALASPKRAPPPTGVRHFEFNVAPPLPHPSHQRTSPHVRATTEVAERTADEPHTPPSHTTLWAKRRGPDTSPGSHTGLSLKLISIKGNEQWQDLQSPLDVFARKHCPSRSRGVGSSEQVHAAAPLTGRPPPLLSEPDEDGGSLKSPSWDRPSNHSPLAALLRREFPSGKPQSERRLFDDL